MYPRTSSSSDSSAHGIMSVQSVGWLERARSQSGDQQSQCVVTNRNSVM